MNKGECYEADAGLLALTERILNQLEGCNQKWDSSLDNALYLEKME